MRLGTKMAVSLQRSHKGLQENVHRNRPLTRLLSGFYCPAACFPPWASILLSRPGESLTFMWGRGKMGLSWSMSWPFIPSSPVWIPCLWVPFKLFWWLIQQQLTAVLSVAAEWWGDEVWGWVGAPSWTRPASNYSLGGITKLLCVYHRVRVCVCVWLNESLETQEPDVLFLSPQTLDFLTFTDRQTSHCKDAALPQIVTAGNKDENASDATGEVLATLVFYPAATHGHQTVLRRSESREKWEQVESEKNSSADCFIFLIWKAKPQGQRVMDVLQELDYRHQETANYCRLNVFTLYTSYKRAFLRFRTVFHLNAKSNLMALLLLYAPLCPPATHSHAGQVRHSEVFAASRKCSSASVIV